MSPPVAPADLAAPTADAETSPRGCTSFKLRQLARRVGRDYDAQLARTGLKTTQYSLLSNILTHGPIAPGELAARMRLDASSLTRNLQPLVAQGWVEQGPGADARSRRVSLTDAGRAKRQEARQAWQRAQAALNERLGLSRVAALHGLIDECLQRLEDDEPVSEGDEG